LVDEVESKMHRHWVDLGSYGMVLEVRMYVFLKGYMIFKFPECVDATIQGNMLKLSDDRCYDLWKELQLSGRVV
jgi:hypothetical protein